MKCREMEGLIALEAGGDLDAAAAAGVREHLAGCGACRALAEALTASQGAFATLREEAPDELALGAWRRGLMERIEAGAGPRRAGWRWAWALAAAAAGLAVVLVLPEVVRRTAPVPEPPPLVAHIGPAVEPEIAPVPPPAPVARSRPRRRLAPRPAHPATEPLLVRLETSDPNVIIYWIVDGKGD